MKPLMPLFVSCLALAAAYQARAEARESEVHVSYADLDLSRPQGRMALAQRIDRAIGKVCPTADGPQQLAVVLRLRDCRAQARKSAHAQLAAISY